METKEIKEKRYIVYSYGWKGWSTIEDVYKYGQYFDTFEEAKREYDRLWEGVLDYDEGACIYDTVEKRMIVEDTFHNVIED